MEEGEGVAEVAQESALVAVLSEAAAGKVQAVAGQEADQEAGPEDQVVENHLTTAVQDHAEHNVSLDGFRKRNTQRSLAYQPCQNSTQNKNPQGGWKITNWQSYANEEQQQQHYNI